MQGDDINIRELTPNRDNSFGIVASSSTCRNCCACSESQFIEDPKSEDLNVATGRSGVLILVSSQTKALEFYTKALGFSVVFDKQISEERWIQVAPADSTTTLTLVEPRREKMSEKEFELSNKGVGKQGGIWFSVGDIHSTYENLKSKGVNITQPEKQDWGGMMSIVVDPDGNRLVFLS